MVKLKTHLDKCVCGHVRNAHGPACGLCYDELGETHEQRVAKCPQFRLKLGEQ